MKYDQDLYPRDEPNAGRIAVHIVLVIAVIAFLAWCAASMQAMALPAAEKPEDRCDYAESLITDALKEEPERLVKVLWGQSLADFLNKMSSKGYLTGTLDQIDSLYIIKGKLLPGFDKPIDILFFVQNGCIVGKIYGDAAIVEGML
jgi:hypothetical protein